MDNDFSQNFSSSDFRSSPISRPNSAIGQNNGLPKSNKPAGFLDTLFGRGRKSMMEQRREDIKKKFSKEAQKTETQKTKQYFASGAAQFGKVAPDLAKKWKTVLPDSFRTRDESKKTMGRIFGVKSGDAWTRREQYRNMYKAVKENRVDRLNLSDYEKKALKYDSTKKREFLKALESIDKRIKS